MVTTASSSSLFDCPDGYGRVSRLLHWVMAAAFGWQFTSAILHAVDREMAISAFFWSTHRPLGLILFVLVLLRGVWGLINLKRRPPYDGVIGTLARLGHLALYALMILIPGVALLRQYGSARAFEPFGIPLMPGGGEQIAWMTSLGNTVHGLAGWLLLALICGHIAMAYVHHAIRKDDRARMMIRGPR